jgi:hypothetical protein
MYVLYVYNCHVIVIFRILKLKACNVYTYIYIKLHLLRYTIFNRFNSIQLTNTTIWHKQYISTYLLITFKTFKRKYSYIL